MALTVTELKNLVFSSLPLERKFEIKICGRPTPKLNIVQVTKGKNRDFKREFNPNLYEKNSWICGCEMTNRLYCFPCLLFANENYDTSHWIKYGVKDLGHLASKIKNHEYSKAHLNSVLEFKLLGKDDITSCSTERVRAFRIRQRALNPQKQPPKSSAQRSREFRQRRKKLKSSLVAEVDTLHYSQEPSTSNKAFTIVKRNSVTTTCNQWILNSGRDDLTQLKDDQLNCRTLCSKHFRDSAFTNASRNKLLRNHPAAVPVAWFEPDLELTVVTESDKKTHLQNNCGDVHSHKGSKGSAGVDVVLRPGTETCLGRVETATDTSRPFKVAKRIHKTTTPTTFESPSVSCPPQSEGSFEGVPLTQTIIKEEIDVPEDDDYSYSSVPGTSVDEDQINFKTSFNEEETDLMDHGSMRSIELETAEPEESAQSSGLSDILKMADALSMNIQSILTDDISNFGHINPTRSANPRKSKSRTDTEPSLAFLKSKYTELESKLRIHYLNSMIKKEEELIDLKIKLYKMQIIREEEELNNNRQNQLLKVENLQLENTLLKTKLARKCNCKCSC